MSSPLTVERPVEIDGSHTSRLNFEVPDSPDSAEFCFVPRNRYTIGGDDLAPKSLPETTLELGGYLIRTYPVTIREYCEFLNDLAREDFDEAKSRSPRSVDQSKYYLSIDPEQRRLSVPETDPEGHEWKSDWPVIMINWYDARKFLEWKSARDGVTYQLPTEVQWEVAARGVDQRVFPWGNGFDPTLCRMVDTQYGRPIPTSVGSHPYDRSPFGVFDMAGLVLEWTRTPSGADDAEQYIQRGGSFHSPSNWCRAASRKSNQADQPNISFGFRYVLEL